MSQNLIALNGGMSRIETESNPSRQTFLSQQYVDVRGLNPYPTEWVEAGRPIYNRLPQTYKLGNDLDEKRAYVYAPPGSTSSSKGSLLVQTSGQRKFLTIQPGIIVWRGGNVPLNSVILDLQLVDLKSTRYLIGYQLYLDDSPFEALYSVKDYSLAGTNMKVSSSTDGVTGWRYQPSFAFSNTQDFFWTNYDSFFPDHSGNASLAWQTEFSNSYSSIKLRCPPGTAYTGTAALYYQSCPYSQSGDKYCSSPEWVLQESSDIQEDSVSQFFQFDIETPSFQRGWKVEWTDSKMSIQAIQVSGTLTLLRRPEVPLTYCQLIAYPQNAVPDKIVTPAGKEVPVTTCGLAIAETNDTHEVTSLVDIRETVIGEVDPVADWLTRTWDTQLLKLREKVLNFPESWLSPPNCLRTEYDELTLDLIKVET